MSEQPPRKTRSFRLEYDPDVPLPRGTPKVVRFFVNLIVSIAIICVMLPLVVGFIWGKQWLIDWVNNDQASQQQTTDMDPRVERQLEWERGLDPERRQFDREVKEVWDEDQD